MSVTFCIQKHLFEVLGIEPGALHMPGKGFMTELL
jgi:hypothetical protein